MSVQHDLTALEREQEKKLREEAKRLSDESNGKDLYHVRGPHWDKIIMKIRK